MVLWGVAVMGGVVGHCNPCCCDSSHHDGVLPVVFLALLACHAFSSHSERLERRDGAGLSNFAVCTLLPWRSC